MEISGKNILLCDCEGTMPLDGRLDVDVDLARLPQTGLSGVVRRSDDSSGIGGATVRIVGGTLEATTDPDGSYDFPEVAIGQQTITAEAFGFSSGEARIVLPPRIFCRGFTLASASSGRITSVLEPNRINP